MRPGERPSPRWSIRISAATASGKTEAAFLPICSALVSGEPAAGVSALYVAPLKALINDQNERLEGLCGDLGIAVHPWHGDIAGSRKSRVLTRPSGILLITPESLEALFVTRGTAVSALFADLRYVVVDELHSFAGIERGAQLQSLLHRLELAIRRRVLTDPGFDRSVLSEFRDRMAQGDRRMGCWR